MANSVTVEVVVDGPRNAIVNVVGVVDTANMTQAPLVSLSQFTANNGWRLVGLRVVDVDYSVTDGLVVRLDWNSSTPQPIMALSGSNEIHGKEHGGLTPNKAVGGYDGSINLATSGFTAGRSYAFTLRMCMTKMYS